MNSLRNFLLGALLLAAIGITAGCVVGGGYVSGGVVVDDGPYYGGWYHDGGWAHGPRGYAHVAVHPAAVHGGGGDHRR